MRNEECAANTKLEMRWSDLIFVGLTNPQSIRLFDTLAVGKCNYVQAAIIEERNEFNNRKYTLSWLTITFY